MAQRFTLRNYWREILLMIMAALLVWTSLTDTTVQTGSTYTDCYTHVDTVTNIVHTRTREYRTITIPNFVIDTIYDTDADTVMYVSRDTVYEYINMPVEEYTDSSTYYVRTLGYLDSIAVYSKTVTVDKPMYKDRPVSLYLHTQIHDKTYAPGAAVTWRRLHVGYNYHPVQKGGIWTLGWKLY